MGGELDPFAGSWFVLEFARLIDWDPLDEGLSASSARRIELPHCPLGVAAFENPDLQPAMDDCEPLLPDAWRRGGA